jgi:hypothetical protein
MKRSLHLLLAVLLAFPGQAPAFWWNKKSKQEKMDTEDTRQVQARTTGEILLRSFDCEGLGGPAVQRVQSSLQKLKNAVAQIQADEKACRQDVAAIASIPEIDSMIESLQASELEAEVKRLEKEVNKARTGLEARRNLPATHPSLAYFPSTDLLLSGLERNEAELLKLKAKLGVEKTNQMNKRMGEGMKQLELLSTRLQAYLDKPDSKCLKEEASRNLKDHVISSLVGISGFFMASPYGIAAMAAGKLLQSVFSYISIPKENSNSAFEGADKLLLVSSLSCTLENLSEQQCRLKMEQDALEASLNPPAMSSVPEKVVISYRDKEKVTRGLDNLDKWGGNSRNLTSDERTVQNQFRENVRKAVRNSYETFDLAMIKLEGDLKQTEGQLEQGRVNAQKKAFPPIVKTVAACLYGGNCAAPTADKESTQGQVVKEFSLATDEEKRLGALNLLYDKEDVGVILKNFEESRKNRGDAPWLLTEAATNAEVWQWFEWVRSGQLPANAEMKVIFDKLATKKIMEDAGRRARERYEYYMRKTWVPPREEIIGRELNRFFQASPTEISTFEALQNVHQYLCDLDPNYVKKKRNFLGIDNLRDHLKTIVGRAEKVERGPDENEDSVEAKKAQEAHKREQEWLFYDLQNLTAPESESRAKVAEILQDYNNWVSTNLSKMNLDPNAYAYLAGKIDKEFVTSVFGTISNPTNKRAEYNMALALGDQQFQGFGTFFKNYLYKGMAALNEEEDDNQNPARRDRKAALKNTFCLHLLSLSTIPRHFQAECQNAQAGQGNNKIEFKKYVDMQTEPPSVADWDKRVCAYTNFLYRESLESQQRERPEKKKQSPAGATATTK